MNSAHFDAVTYDGSVYCCKCLESATEGVYPIFADSEWDSYPVCDICGQVHDYVKLTEYGQRIMQDRFRNIRVTVLTYEALAHKPYALLNTMGWALSRQIQALEKYEQLIESVLNEKEKDR